MGRGQGRNSHNKGKGNVDQKENGVEGNDGGEKEWGRKG